ncbi:GNAT family N-acetyltransferase [Micromonospora sp. WMMD1102]|uniref:GNAT family N-acetyltransferase n=1 Tax=Micromonospora sp. WMMD1102 TaxID=3016105 RepID=UPI00241546B9|nr:GNAT family N-acetyltransferase [Micromonospora sp. WMMD1102]MDG4790166.1 GNAT family N-acetyltransferase [Micromonospora sp. WMMD1102]
MTVTAPQAEIRRATENDAEQIVQLLTDAFLTGPVADWLVPDETIRRKVYLGYFAIWAAHALENGLVYTTADLSGTALWYPRAHTAEPVNYRLRLAEAAGPWLFKFLMLDDTFALHHPGWSHHYLAFLAVDPQRQSAGIGSALLRHHHARLGSKPAYLEASNERNRDLYLRHGYRTTGPFYLPRGGPPIWPMRYEPTPTSCRSALAETAVSHQPESGTLGETRPL